MKNLKYLLLYLYYGIKFCNKKVRIPFLEIWVGQFCNLNCRNCCHLIPYLEQKVYDMDQIIEDCRKLFRWCEVDFFSIVGGEPFAHPEMKKLIEFVAGCSNITKGKIVTNGTIIPHEQTLEALERLNGKLEIRIDGYPGIGIGIVEQFANLMRKYGIPYHFTRFNPDKPSSWKQLTPKGRIPLDKKIVKILFKKCNIRDCNTLANGELVLCPRGIGSKEVFGIHKNKYEHIYIRQLKGDIMAKAWIAMGINRRIPKDYCQFCLSLSEKNHRYVIPGEQI